MINVMGIGAKKIVYILIQGLVILGSALVLNTFANIFGITTWYDFVKQPTNTDSISIIWLFLIYPFALGTIAYLTGKFLYK